jgi:ABC-type amino acid transport substrate-binding protein
MRDMTAAPVPRFRSSPHLAAPSRANFGIGTLVAVLVCAASVADAAESADCAVAAPLVHADYGLPRVAAALERERRLTVVVVGAGSSTLGGPGGAALAYPARLEAVLAQRLPGIATKVVASVRPGRTAEEMAATFGKILTDEKPTLVVWQSGTVDAIKGVDPEEFRLTLDEGVEELQAGGADVVLMNMQYSPRTESMIAINAYADGMRVVSQQREVSLLDRFAIMKQWSELGVFDFFAATRRLETAARIHDCIAQLLADLVRDGVKLGRAKQKANQ